MILELFLVLTGLAIIFFLASIGLILSRRNAIVSLIIEGLLLLATGTLIASEGLQIQEGNNLECDEDSEYWNCSVLNHTCTGTPGLGACISYTKQQCNELNAVGENCTWLVPNQYCYGTPTWTCQILGAWGHENGYGQSKCDETYGCTHTRELIEGTCDKIVTNCTTTYTYTNYTGNVTSPSNEIDILYLALILSGLFFILWGAVQGFEREHEEEE